MYMSLFRLSLFPACRRSPRRILRSLLLFILLCVLCASLAGCAPVRGEPSAQPDTGSGEASPDESGQNAPSIESGSPAGVFVTVDVDEILSRYGAGRYWRDATVSFRFFLLTDESLICLLAVPDVEQTTVIPLSSIASVDAVRAGSWTFVTVSDNGGGSVSVTLTPEDADNFRSALGME